MTAELAARVYADIVAPLVFGGALRPGRPIGGAAALTLSDYASAVDSDLRSRTDLGRGQLARALFPIDVMPAATKDDWILFAALHDWLVAVSPELVGVLSPRAGDRVVGMLETALDAAAPPKTPLAALSRHSFFARLLDVRRNDVRVSFWAGEQSFRGKKPPEYVWSRLRRVRAETTARPLVSLPEHGGRVDRERWLATLVRLLRLTPLTDLATVARDEPGFVWSPETLGLVATHTGRTLAARALRIACSRAGDPSGVLGALGRASRALLERRAFKSAAVAAELHAEVVVDLASSATPGEWSRLSTEADRTRDLFLGLAFGALTFAARGEHALTSRDAEHVATRLLPIARSDEARKLLDAPASS